MVFVLKSPDSYNPSTGLIIVRNTGKYASLLIVESLLGTIVAVSNILVISVMIAGWKRLMKHDFFIVVAHVIFFTSLKAAVELGFILPYYVMQSDGKNENFGYFSKIYSSFIFNLSVFADYGVLFFSLLVAVNRYFAVMKTSSVSKSSRIKVISACLFVLVCSITIPLLYFICKCEYNYNPTVKLYHNMCNASSEMKIVINALAYLSYACSTVAMLLYIRIYIFLRHKRRNKVTSNATNFEGKMLRQSILIFLLYAASILSVVGISFIPAQVVKDEGFIFDVAYAENLLNLSVAAVYPICFLTMSGEMKSVLISKIVPTRAPRVVSISSQNNGNNRNNGVVANSLI